MTSTMMLGAPIHAINDTEAPVLCSRADPIYLYILSIVVFSSRDYTGGLTVAMYELQSQAPSTPSCEKKDGLENENWVSGHFTGCGIIPVVEN